MKTIKIVSLFIAAIFGSSILLLHVRVYSKPEEKKELIDYYAAVLPHNTLLRARTLKTDFGLLVECRQHYQQCIWATENVQDAKMFVRTISVQRGLACTFVNLRSDAKYKHSYELDEVFFAARLQASSTEKPVILFFENCDFLLCENNETTDGINALAFQAKLEEYRVHHRVIVIVHITSSEFVKEPFKKYVSQFWERLPLVDAHFRMKFASAVFAEFGIMVEDELLDIIAKNTFQCTLKAIRNLVTFMVKQAKGTPISQELIQDCIAFYAPYNVQPRFTLKPIHVCCGILVSSLLGSSVVAALYVRHLLKHRAKKVGYATKNTDARVGEHIVV